MKVFKFPSVLASILASTVILVLAGPGPLSAQSSHKHRKAPPADSDDSDASPTPSPTPRGRHGGSNQAKAEATPSPKPESSDKPSTTPEVTPDQSRKTDATKAGSPPDGHPASSAATSSIEPADIENFDAQPAPIRQLLAAALDLTKQNLTYTYGSADPSAGGMDCSGTIYYLLKERGFVDVPRQANEQYSWVRTKSRFYAVLGKRQDTPELNEMRPGDLLFWSGTYNVDRDPPVTHAMIYLGRRKKDGHRLMVGSSDGRPYDGQRRKGVSVFDFRTPCGPQRRRRRCRHRCRA